MTLSASHEILRYSNLLYSIAISLVQEYWFTLSQNTDSYYVLLRLWYEWNDWKWKSCRECIISSNQCHIYISKCNNNDWELKMYGKYTEYNGKI